jgi:DNA helicase-2/ATP-dependent DNA helicase PcrA
MNASAIEMAENEWVNSLNTAQRDAAMFGRRSASHQWESPPLLIIAGAGTGKTNTLAHRVAYLKLNGVQAERILLLTFTRRAAQEMSRRAERIVQHSMMNTGTSAAFKLSWAGTFHSIANRLLRQRAHQVGLDPSFSILDRGDAADLLDVARQELGFAKKQKRFPRKDTCLAIYSHKVNTQLPLTHTLKENFPWCSEWTDELTQLFRKYVEIKQQQQVLDYDDLLLYWHVAMQENSFAAQVGALFDHVLVDEYQDTNTLQADILFALKPDGNGLCVVGDDAQAIYSFRAASVENILSFPDRFTPPAKIAKLEQNYRSVQPILDAANAVIGEGTRQYQKHLYSQQTSQQKPWYVTVEDDQAQANYIVERVLATREEGVLLKQQAVLMRSSHHSDVLELELTRRNIPYVKYGGLKFLEAAHVKDVLAILKWADNPRNKIAALRVLQLLPGVGPGHASRCFNVFEASGFSWELLCQYQMPTAAQDEWTATTTLLVSLATASEWIGQLSHIRKWYEPHLLRIYDAAAVRMGDIEQLEKIAGSYATRERFITELTLEPPQASGDLSGPPLLDEDYLILSTIHSAKGQEWNSVYLLNFADGNFPSEFSTGKPALLEEERRLLYVAMTRAKQNLHLIAPLKYYVTQQSRSGDKHVYGAKSRFLSHAIMTTLRPVGWPTHPSSSQRERNSDHSQARMDIKERMREMWK